MQPSSQLAQITLSQQLEVFLLGLLGSLYSLQFLVGFAAALLFSVNLNVFEMSHKLYSSCRRKVFPCPHSLQSYCVPLVLNMPSYHHGIGTRLVNHYTGQVVAILYIRKWKVVFLSLPLVRKMKIKQRAHGTLAHEKSCLVKPPLNKTLT